MKCTIEGIPCIINPAHAIYLFGMEIDWKSGLDARGFVLLILMLHLPVDAAVLSLYKINPKIKKLL